MARLKTPTEGPGGGPVDGRPFTRSPEDWRRIAPDTPAMWDDGEAVRCYGLWVRPRCGPAGLRLTRVERDRAGGAPSIIRPDDPRWDGLKVHWLRRTVAPRVLWRAGALAPAELARLYGCDTTPALWTTRAPEWIRTECPWWRPPREQRRRCDDA